MMTLDYNRERARWGCQKMECLFGTLSCHMGEGCGPSPVLPGTVFRLCFQLRLCHEPMDLSWALGGWQSSGSRRPLQEMLPDRSFPVLKQIGNSRLTCLRLLEMFVSPRALVNSVGPVGLSSDAEKTLEPLEQMVHTQTDPAGQFSAVGTCPHLTATLLALLACLNTRRRHWNR